MPRNIIIAICLLLAVQDTIAQIDTSVNFDQASDSLLHQLKNTQLPDTFRLNTLIELAILYCPNQTDKSLEYARQAEQIADRSQHKALKAKVHFMFANIYMNKANYQNSLFHYLRALRLFEDLGKTESIARTLHNIGVIYSYIHNTDKAEQYFNEGLAIREKYKYYDEIGIVYTGLGYISETKKNYKEALTYYYKTLKIGKISKHKYTIGIAYIDIGSIYLKMHNTRLAEDYLKLALQMSLKIKNQYQLSTIYMYLSEIATLNKDSKKAESYLQKAMFNARKSGMRGLLIESYKNLSDLYHTQGRDKEAYAYRLYYEQINDSAINKKTDAQVTHLQSAYEIEKKNNEIKLLNKDKEIVVAKASKDLLWRNVLIILCLFILILTFILLHNMSLKQRLNRTLKSQNRALEQENISAKYEVLKSRVNPHFLFNSLNTLSSIIESDKLKAIEFIEHFSELFRQILESGEISFIPLGEEIRISQNYIYLQKVRFGNKLHIETSLTDEINYTVPSFAIQMILENAIKHNTISAAKHLYITITQTGNTLIIENNLQPKTNNTHSTKVGQYNITERYKQFSEVPPSFEQKETHYRVTLPLIHKGTGYRDSL